jgi:DMSO/TMAO reductase YedYZ heme-binding membrane subunit
MNEQVWWYLSRASGIVALVLLTASVVWGVLLATRALAPHDRPAWLLDLHRWLGGVALVMTGFHIAGLVLDGYVTFGVAEILVPGASRWRPVAVAIGVVSMYLLVAVEVSSLLMRRLPRRAWRTIHVSSYLVVWSAAVHAGLAGTDVGNRAYQGVALFLTFAAVSAGIVRILTPSRAAIARASGARRRREPVEPTPDVLAEVVVGVPTLLEHHRGEAEAGDGATARLEAVGREGEVADRIAAERVDAE